MGWGATPIQSENLIQLRAIVVNEGDDPAVGVAAGYHSENGKQQHMRQLIKLTLGPSRVRNFAQQGQKRGAGGHGSL
jgi:hypothetical protein